MVSLTSDRYINKGTYRPHIPEKVRALNIAALEIVNYVIVDDNKTPINLIKKLKPDYFAKVLNIRQKVFPKKLNWNKKQSNHTVEIWFLRQVILCILHRNL